MINKDFKSILELIQAFPNEQACINHLEALRWNGNIISPFDAKSKVYKCKNNKYRCKNTGKYFNVKTNTLFDNTKIELQKWFLAIWLVTCHKKGISSLQLARDIHVTQKTAWFMLQRIRNCFGSDNDGDLDGTVEIDETFVGGKNKNRHKDKKVPMSQGRSFKDKTPVFGMLQRGGNVIAKVVADTSIKSLLPNIYRHIKRGSTIYTDEWNYGNLSKYFTHRFIRHAAKVYVNGDIYTNTIEGFWGIFKRGIVGIYQSVSRKHLQKYVDEFVFRYNSRKSLEHSRFNLMLKNLENKLTYTNLIHV